MEASAGLWGGHGGVGYAPAPRGIPPHLALPHLPVVEAAAEREDAAGQVPQPDVVALEDDVAQGAALQGWGGAHREAREEAAGADLQGTLRREHQDHEQPPEQPPTSEGDRHPRKHAVGSKNRVLGWVTKL